MTKNPFLSAISATAYISAIVSGAYYIPKLVEPVESVFAPIAFLSLFVLSAAIMGYLFCLEPLKLFLENKKEEAIRLFLKTVGYFALVTLIIFCLLLVFSVVSGPQDLSTIS